MIREEVAGLPLPTHVKKGEDMPSALISILKIVLGLLSVTLIGTWIGWVFMFDTVSELYNVSATSNAGINMLKSSMGGFVLALGAMSLMAIWKGGQWYAAATMGIGIILGTRLISLVQDGANALVWAGIAMEAVAFIAAFLLLLNDRQESMKQG